MSYLHESATVTDLGRAQEYNSSIKLGNQSVENIWSQKADMAGSFPQLIITQHKAMDPG